MSEQDNPEGAIIFDLRDPDQRAIASDLMLSAYLGQVCPVCEIEFESLEALRGSVFGMKDVSKGQTAGNLAIVHAPCFYKEQATDEWREAHPEAKPQE